MVCYILDYDSHEELFRGWSSYCMNVYKQCESLEEAVKYLLRVLLKRRSYYAAYKDYLISRTESLHDSYYTHPWLKFNNVKSHSDLPNFDQFLTKTEWKDQELLDLIDQVLPLVAEEGHDCPECGACNEEGCECSGGNFGLFDNESDNDDSDSDRGYHSGPNQHS